MILHERLTYPYMVLHRDMLNDFTSKVPDRINILLEKGIKVPSKGDPLTRDFIQKSFATEIEEDDPCVVIVSAIGQWIIENSHSMWTVGPIHSTELESVSGVGIETIKTKSFAPLSRMVKDTLSSPDMDSIGTLVAFSRVATLE